MGKIISFEKIKTNRRNFVFINKAVQITNYEGEIKAFPCIALYEKETMIPVAYPGFERWIFNMSKAEIFASSTLKKKALNVCKFLNYILWDTSCDTLADITVEVIKGFVKSYKYISEDKCRDPDG